MIQLLLAIIGAIGGMASRSPKAGKARDLNRDLELADKWKATTGKDLPEFAQKHLWGKLYGCYMQSEEWNDPPFFTLFLSAWALFWCQRIGSNLAVFAAALPVDDQVKAVKWLWLGSWLGGLACGLMVGRTAFPVIVALVRLFRRDKRPPKPAIQPPTGKPQGEEGKPS